MGVYDGTTMTTMPPRKYRMVALDLDGTLLHSNHEISSATVDYLRELHSRGLVICIATGRAAPSTYTHVAHLNLEGGMPVVCFNGAKGLHCTSIPESDTSIPESEEEEEKLSPNVTVRVRELFSTPVPQNVTDKTLEVAKSLGHVSQYYHDQDIYADPIHDHHYELTKQYMLLTGAKTIYREDLKVDGCLPSKLLVLCRNHELDRSFEIFQKELGDDATLVYGSQGWFLEVLHPQVNKGHGLRQMCDALGIPLEQCIAFGDGDNDIEFIKMAGNGIVMKNGREVVKQHADEIIDYTNNEVCDV
jgi:hydroxymethylpyrimidine pyrophosphatase-like HAD family hydrolase